MFRPGHFGAALIAAALLTAGTAHGDIVTWEAWWVDQSPYNPDNTGWSFDLGTGTWSIWEDYVVSTVDEGIAASAGSATRDPSIHISKTVTNNSTFEWTGFHIEISGSAGVNYVAGSAVSDVFQTVVENGNILDFMAPGSVPIGSDVTFDLDIALPAGSFQFEVIQMPVPEPTALVLAIPGLLLLARRR